MRLGKVSFRNFRVGLHQDLLTYIRVQVQDSKTKEPQSSDFIDLGQTYGAKELKQGYGTNVCKNKVVLMWHHFHAKSQ